MQDGSVLGPLLERDPALKELRELVRRRLDGGEGPTEGQPQGTDPGHDLSHALRVAAWTVRLAGEGASPRCAVAAALLHDVVNVPKSSSRRSEASARAAEEARELLPRFGFRERETDEIAEAIRDHSYSRGAVPTSTLGRALQDADRLEAVGAVGLFRTISTGTRMGARYFHPEDPWAERRPRDDLAYTVDHFFEKLLSLPERMNTDEGRAEACRRVELMRSFLRQLAEELGHAPPPSIASVIGSAERSLTPPTTRDP